DPDEFDLYDVMFPTGPGTVRGRDLRLIDAGFFSCEVREHLFSAYTRAIDVYSRLASEMVDAVGQLGHTEFEFLCRKVEMARSLTRAARECLTKHRAEHGC